MSKMKITKDQYYSLNPMAKELHDYWMNFKPKMYKELANSGKLWSVLQSEGDRLNEIVIDNLQALGIAGAKELARAEIYDAWDEPMEENPEELTEQDKRNKERWETHRELMNLLNGTLDELRNQDK